MEGVKFDLSNTGQVSLSRTLNSLLLRPTAHLAPCNKYDLAGHVQEIKPVTLAGGSGSQEVHRESLMDEFYYPFRLAGIINPLLHDISGVHLGFLLACFFYDFRFTVLILQIFSRQIFFHLG